jgi:hypothetical protein
MWTDLSILFRLTCPTGLPLAIHSLGVCQESRLSLPSFYHAYRPACTPPPALLAAALACFTQHGLRTTSTHQLAQAAGLSHGSLPPHWLQGPAA